MYFDGMQTDLIRGPRYSKTFTPWNTSPQLPENLAKCQHCKTNLHDEFRSLVELEKMQ